MKAMTEHISFDSVSDLLEKTPEERRDYELRCELLTVLREHIQRSDMTQAAVAKALGVAQPRVSDLVRGKVSKFSVGTLLEFLISLGFTIAIKPTPPKAAASKAVAPGKRATKAKAAPELETA